MDTRPEGAPAVRALVEEEHATVPTSLLVCGTLVIRFLDEAGQPLDAPPHCIPTLRPLERGRAGQPMSPYWRSRRIAGLGGLPPSSWRFPTQPMDLLPGTYTVSIEDEQGVVKGVRRIRLQPFGPVPGREVAIRQRETTTLDLIVRARCRVSLDVLSPGGRPPRGRPQIKVYRVDKNTGQRVRYLSGWEPLQSRVPMPMNRFDGYLQAGTYEVELTPAASGNEPRIEQLVVKGPRVQKTYVVEPTGR